MSLAIVGCRNKQPTPLQETNIEKLKKAVSGDFVLCLIPGTYGVKNVKKALLAVNNDQATTLYGFSFHKLHMTDILMVDYNTFRDCEVIVEKNPELYKLWIGEIIMNGLHDNNPTSSAKPDEK